MFAEAMPPNQHLMGGTFRRSQKGLHRSELRIGFVALLLCEGLAKLAKSLACLFACMRIMDRTGIPSMPICQ